MLQNRPRIYLAAAATIAAFAGLLTGCSSDAAGTASPTSENSISTTQAQITVETSTSTVTPSLSSPSATSKRVVLSPTQLADMSDLTEVSALPYTGNGLGTHFSALDSTVGCKFTPAQGTCYVVDPPEWRSGDWCAINRNDLVSDSNLIGWGNPPAPYTQAPEHCARQGTSGVGPDYAASSAVLDYGTKMTILLSIADKTSVTCGSRPSGLTCVLEPGAAHGFHVSSTDYLTW